MKALLFVIFMLARERFVNKLLEKLREENWAVLQTPDSRDALVLMSKAEWDWLQKHRVVRMNAQESGQKGIT